LRFLPLILLVLCSIQESRFAQAAGETAEGGTVATDTDKSQSGTATTTNAAASGHGAQASATESASVGSSNPFVQLFGESLYKWADSREEIHQISTEELLKNKDVIAIYFSASWCGPCRQFTPILAQFYEEMNKKGKKFEVVWVSRDNSQDEFIQYYHKMPWLAVPMETTQKCLQLTAPKYQLKGIPHLVILDGVDATVYTLDGRTKIQQDKYGLEFPWRPRTIMNMLPRPVKAMIQKQIDSFKFKLQKLLQGMMEGLLPNQLIKQLLSPLATGA